MSDQILFRENSLGESVPCWTYDFNKPRKNEGAKKAQKVYAKYKGWKPDDARIRRMQIHHIDCDRSRGAASNLFVVKDCHQHSKLHGQLQAMNSFLIKHGYVAFDRFKKFYYAADKRLQDIFKEIAIKEHNTDAANVDDATGALEEMHAAVEAK